MTKPPIPIPAEDLADFCRRWRITELVLFGSAVGGDFGPHSDVDVLVASKPDSRFSSVDLMDLQRELAELLGRPVDVLTRESVEQCGNPWKRHAILSKARILHTAA
jgi:uncharacterized protein